MNELIPTRATLIERLKNWQDQSSWQDFFDTYWQLIYNVARKGGLTEAEAQDVVQETMVSVAKQMPKFQYDPAIGSFKAWLLNMTRWRIVDQFRKRGPLPERQFVRFNIDAVMRVDLKTQLEVFKLHGNFPSTPALYPTPEIQDFTSEFFSGAPAGKIFSILRHSSVFTRQTS